MSRPTALPRRIDSSARQHPLETRPPCPACDWCQRAYRQREHVNQVAEKDARFLVEFAIGVIRPETQRHSVDELVRLPDRFPLDEAERSRKGLGVDRPRALASLA